MPSKAHEILDKVLEERCKDTFPVFMLLEHEEAVLAAMKEIASIAFAAGMDSTIKNTTLVHKLHQTGKKVNIAQIQKAKEQFIENLFNNEVDKSI